MLLTSLLADLGMDPDEVAVVAGAVGNHGEETGSPVNHVAAALILADKSDVHRTRVRNPDAATFDIHDRVNYAAVRSFLNVEPAGRTITLELTIETEICPVMEYFEIFLHADAHVPPGSGVFGLHVSPEHQRGRAALAGSGFPGRGRTGPPDG